MLLQNDPHIQSLWTQDWAGEEVTCCQGVTGKGSTLFGEGQLESDISPVVPILYGFAFIPDVRRILEIGVGPGFSTRAFYRGLSDSGGGQMVSVDIKDCSGSLPRDAGGNVRAKFIQAHSTSERSRVEKTVGESGIDLLFIDGCHSLKQVVGDFDAYFGLIRPKGYIIFHDTQTMRGAYEATEVLAKSLPGVKVFSSNGLSIFQKGE